MVRVVLSVVAALFLQGVWMSAVYAPTKELVFAVYPYPTSSQIVQQFIPLKEYIAKSLGRPVTRVLAPDFPNFIVFTASK